MHVAYNVVIDTNRGFFSVVKLCVMCLTCFDQHDTTPHSSETKPLLGLNLVHHHTSTGCQVNISQPDEVMPYL